MHESARRGLTRVLRGTAVLAALVLVVALLLRGCKSDEERLSEAVYDARDALTDRDSEEFLAFFAPEVTYQGKPARSALERDVDRWVDEFRVGRIAILDEPKIVVEGTTARITLRCDVGTIIQSLMQVDVTLRAVKTDGEWRVTEFSWKQ